MIFNNSSTTNILGMNVHATTSKNVSQRIMAWAIGHESRYVCMANVHMALETYDTPSFQKVVNQADLVAPDGKPIALFMSLAGETRYEQVRGPDLTIELCALAQEQACRIGFYGGKRESLLGLQENLGRLFPDLRIAYMHSPPFRPLTSIEDEQVVREINASGTRILFVGLGCPKQEKWMAEHRGRIRAVMVGVGQAFDIHGGMIREAPGWMQAAGLEWFFRLVCEPKRLWKRYLKNNPRFVYHGLRQLLRQQR